MTRARSNFAGSLFLLLLTCLLAGAADAPSQKVVLQLQNGDKLTGEVLSENKERLVLRTAWKEKLTIPKAQIVKREAPAAPVAVATTTAPVAPPAPAVAAVPPVAAPAATPVAPATATAPATGTTNTAKVVSPPAKPWSHEARRFFTNWNGSVELGANISRGTRNMNLYHGVLSATHLSLSNRLKNAIDFRIDKGSTEGVTSADRMDGALKTDFDISKDKKTYVYNVGGAGYDNVQLIDLSYREGPGLGYKLVNETNLLTKADALKVSVEAGALYQKFEYSTGREKQVFSMRFAEDLGWTFTEPKITFTQKFEIMPSVEDPSDFTAIFKTDVAWPIMKRVTLKFSLLDEYTSRPVSTVKKNNLQLRTSLGVTF